MTARTPKIVVVGGAFVDLAIRCSQIPSAGRNIAGSALSYTATGPGINQAVQAVLCGCDVRLISKVGDCPFTETVRTLLEQFNVNYEFVYTAKAKNTGVVVTVVDAEGENASVTYSGANSAMLPEDIERAEQAIADADICLIHGRLPRAAVIKAILTAKLHGTKVILDPAGAIEPENETTADIDASLPAEYFSADILIPNLYEAALITDRSSANFRTAKLIGSDMVTRGAAAAVITMGKRGCMVVDRNDADHVPAFLIDLVDPTGTGDAFAGALAAACAVGDELRKAVRFAAAAGALACTKFGSVEALPTKAEIIELLQKQTPE